MTGWPFGHLQMFGYDVIDIDPRGTSSCYRRPERRSRPRPTTTL